MGEDKGRVYHELGKVLMEGEESRRLVGFCAGASGANGAKEKD